VDAQRRRRAIQNVAGLACALTAMQLKINPIDQCRQSGSHAIGGPNSNLVLTQVDHQSLLCGLARTSLDLGDVADSPSDAVAVQVCAALAWSRSMRMEGPAGFTSKLRQIKSLFARGFMIADAMGAQRSGR
jgi:hypothetical protein